MDQDDPRPLLAEVPGPDAPVPPMVQAIAGERAVRAVWVNELGGRTFELTDAAGGRQFLKWNPLLAVGTDSRGIDLRREVERLGWAGRHVRVPRVVDTGADTTAQWLLTEALPGSSAVAERWRADPATAVRAIGEGLRALHDTLPTATCPYTWADDQRVAAAHRRAGGPQASRDAERARWSAEHAHLTWAVALAVLADAPPVDRLVVCHGDACAPNTLIGDDGRWSGHVDLGHLGVADRWADLAVAAWSTLWNYGPGWTRPLLDAYGIDEDADRMAWYRLLWDLS